MRMSALAHQAAWLYSGWGLFLLLGCMGPHLLVVALYLRGWWRSRPSRWLLAAELVYGLVNPVVYLLVFQPALFRRWAPGWFVVVCWLGWAAYWSARFFGRGWLGERRRWVRRLLQATLVLVIGITLRDAVAILVGAIPCMEPFGLGLGDVLGGLFCLPLYALPLMIAVRELAATASGDHWGTTNDFFVGRLPRWAPTLVVALCVLGVAATLPRTSEEEARALILRHRDTIIAVSKERRLDPRLLAAIIEVTQRDINRPFRSGVEEFVTEVWLADATSHLFLAEALDPSLGLTQVKAQTVLAGALILDLSDPTTSRGLRKDYRSVRALNAEALDRIPSPALQAVHPGPDGPLPAKADVVAALKRPETNLAYAAFLLDLVAAQWEAANPAWSIRSRPEIMATLFQVGFGHSVPKPNPIANEFGERVKKAYDKPW
jgi:hypothetical protein